MTVFVCNVRHTCQACRIQHAAGECSFALRGRHEGKICGKKVCVGCSMEVPGSPDERVCLPHARAIGLPGA